MAKSKKSGKLKARVKDLEEELNYVNHRRLDHWRQLSAAKANLSALIAETEALKQELAKFKEDLREVKVWVVEEIEKIDSWLVGHERLHDRLGLTGEPGRYAPEDVIEDDEGDEGDEGDGDGAGKVALELGGETITPAEWMAGVRLQATCRDCGDTFVPSPEDELTEEDLRGLGLAGDSARELKRNGRRFFWHYHAAHDNGELQEDGVGEITGVWTPTQG